MKLLLKRRLFENEAGTKLKIQSFLTHFSIKKEPKINVFKNEF